MGNWMRFGTLLVGVCVLSVSPAGGQQKTAVPGGPTTAGEETRRFKEALARLEKEYESELATRSKLRDQGAMTEAEVDEVRLDLAWMRRNQGIIENQPETVRVQLKTVIEIRDREWERLQTLQRMAGVGLSELLAAQRRQVVARYDLARHENKFDTAARELREIVRICEDELKVLAALGNAVAGREEAGARYRLAFARYRLARHEGRAEDAVRELRTTVANWEAYLDRLVRSPHASILPVEEEFIRLEIQFDRYLISVTERNPEGVRKHLREAIAIAETIEKRLQGDPAGFSKLWKAAWDHNLALTRYYLARAEAGHELPDNLWRLLEW